MFDLIIVTYNALPKLKRCLDSIARHTSKIPYSLTILDNCSQDGTRRFLGQYQKKINVQVLHTPKNLGFSGGANFILRRTSKPFIALLDDDIELTAGWLEKLYRHLHS